MRAEFKGMRCARGWCAEIFRVEDQSGRSALAAAESVKPGCTPRAVAGKQPARLTCGLMSGVPSLQRCRTVIFASEIGARRS
eukprot:750531-Pleurochrysis_carterae.AAC.1